MKSPSDIISENIGKVFDPAEKASLKASLEESKVSRIEGLQRVGTKLRGELRESYIAAKAVEKIATWRKTSGGYQESAQMPQPKSLRHATIIDSLKHPEETGLLRKVYGDIYWQFTIFAPEAIRETRFKLQNITKDEIAGIFARDEDDKEGEHGQKVSKTAYLSDFFIRNDKENSETLKSVLQRYLEIIFNVAVHTPTADEAGMYAAVSAARRSACLSRQVGAALYSADGELISVGWNDVPKAFGGLYSADDKREDHRCFIWGDKICHNDRKKDDLYKKIYQKLEGKGLLKDKVNEEELRKALIETPVSDLIEYSRSIHAEMEAIVSAGRAGKAGMKGGTLYTTTFPCHNCARHIVASGIAKVYYIEPYAKSLALELHHDAIETAEESKGKVAFLQYEGVGPKSALKLFHHNIERKSDGKAVVFDKKIAKPVLCPPMFGFTTREKHVMAYLRKFEEGESTTAETGE